VDGPLFVRDVGAGQPVVVLHGGPAFDHEYLLPETDRLAGAFRVVYYDQRGRGRSFPCDGLDDISIASEVEDLDRVREAFGFPSVAVLGHSWGALLALEYALAHPGRVSHLVLVGSAPASHEEHMAIQRQFASTGLPEDFDRLAGRLRRGRSADGVTASRAIQQRLHAETLDAEGYDLVPRLGGVRAPTLVLHGDRDFIPVGMARRIADAIAGARLVVLTGCGHFVHVDQPDELVERVTAFCQVASAEGGSA
jgi:proline iminopeptidase